MPDFRPVDFHTVVEQQLAKLEPRLLKSIMIDDIDPETAGLYYSSERRTRHLCSLGDVRAMARIAWAARLERDGNARTIARAQQDLLISLKTEINNRRGVRGVAYIIEVINRALAQIASQEARRPMIDEATDAAMQDWRRACDQATANAKRAMADREFAASMGWELRTRPTRQRDPILDAMMADQADEPIRSPFAQWLEQAAKAQIPDKFRYEVCETMGGGAYLALTGIADVGE